ncbi:MAG: hypothetical protein AAB797_00145 [Patescibacteria group bacterium]
MPETKGPYREMPDQDAEALAQMKKEVAAEGNVGIQLPENIKIGAGVVLFGDAIDDKLEEK